MGGRGGALASLVVAALFATLTMHAGEVARGDLAIVGLGLEVAREPVVTAVDVPSYLQTIFGGKTGDEAPPAPGLSVLGELTGPGIDAPITLSTTPGQKFAIPALHEKGDYTLSNIRLAGESGEFLQQAIPSAATIQVTEVLQTKMKVRQLTAAELRERGIVIDERNYEVFGRLKLVRNKDAGIGYDEYDLLGRPQVTRAHRYLAGTGLESTPVLLDVHSQRHTWSIHDGERTSWRMPAVGARVPVDLPGADWLDTIVEMRDAGSNLVSQTKNGGALLMTGDARSAGRLSVRRRHSATGETIASLYGFADGKVLPDSIELPPFPFDATVAPSGLPLWSETSTEGLRVAGRANVYDQAQRLASMRDLATRRVSAWGYDDRGRLTDTSLDASSIDGPTLTETLIDAHFRAARHATPFLTPAQHALLGSEAAKVEPLTWTATRTSAHAIDARTLSLDGVDLATRDYTFAGGRRTSDGLWTYVFDELGRVVSAESGDRRIELTWDPNNRLVGRAAYELAAGGGWEPESREHVIERDGLPAATTFVWDPIVDRLVAIYAEGASIAPLAPLNAGLLRQYVHGDNGYDDPTRVLVAQANGDPATYFPVADEAGTGSLSAVLNDAGNLIERVLYTDSYGDAPRYLHGAVADKIALKLTKNGAGNLESVKVRVHLSERVDESTLATGARLASVKADHSLAQLSSVVPELEDDFTIRWSLSSSEWNLLAGATDGTSLEVSLTSALRAEGWGATPVMPLPSWARQIYSGADATSGQPVIYRESLVSISSFASTIGSNSSASRNLYQLDSLYLAASEESKSRLLFDFKAAPFVEPATGLVYLRDRWYDASTGTFLTPDRYGARDSSNLYAGFALDPVNNSDPTGEYVESLWDAASLGLGLYQISQWDENTSIWAKALDVVGVGVDAAALALPLVPGGIGAALKAYRAGDALHDAHALGRSIDRTLDTAQGIDQSLNTIQASINIADDVRNGNVGWGTGLNALQAVIGWRSMSTRGIGGYRLDFSGGHATASMNGLGGVRITRVSRDVAGVATGGENLPEIARRWFRGSAGNAALVPRQIADRLRGREFESFDDFRRAFWMAVGEDDTLVQGFSRSNIRRMKQGFAPRVTPTQRLGGQRSYILHHRQPLQRGGGLYDLGNLLVVTPRYHLDVLSPRHHYFE